MNIIGIIPSRYGSTRFPGKPLAMIKGKSMIQRVYEQALKAHNLSQVIVATDDDRIFNHVISFGGKALMTSSLHTNGTSRCLEVLKKTEQQQHAVTIDAVINIQGDEPFVRPEDIDNLTKIFSDSKADIATLAKKISQIDDINDPNTVKVVMDVNQFALYFSRQAIPYVRGAHSEQWQMHHDFFKHIGLYGYRTDILKKIALLPPSPLESSEKLEQLRWLENGFKIKVKTTDFESSSVDTPGDLKKITDKIC